MPYIIPEKREKLDPIVEDLICALTELQGSEGKDNMEGNLNYVFSKVLAELYVENYGDINSAIGLLNCIALEFYTRVAVPYEAQKAFENGDVYNNGSI